MPATYVPSYNTKIHVDLGSGYVEIGQVIDITPPETSTPAIERKFLTSTSVGRRPGITSTGPCNFTIAFDPADSTHKNLHSEAQAPALRDWKIVYADSGTADEVFSGFLGKFGVQSINRDGTVTAGLMVEVDHVTTLTQ